MAEVRVFGIRHHGPGSARSLVAALEAFGPDRILVEGPPEGSRLIPAVADAALMPPVAILAYDPDEPSRSGFYPFAVFSPEWQALRYAVHRKVASRFIDLPLVHALLVDRTNELLERLGAGVPGAADAEGDGPAETEPETPPETEPETPPEAPPGEDEILDLGAAVELPAEVQIRLDPLGYIGRLAGEDGERWWERLVEERRDPTDAFEAIAMLMGELRDAVDVGPSDLRREAAMRQAIRAAAAEPGAARVAVVCGAWHAPALVEAGDPAADATLLAGLPRTKVETTWVPWSETHLAAASGYGAGVESPGWYGHLWTTSANLTESWMTKVGRVLREEGLDVSSAHLIEASRLGDTLAALRGRAVPGLPEMHEAARAVLTFGADLPLQLVTTKLIIGTALGSVPDTGDVAPLARDLAAAQRRLRLPPDVAERALELDLRGEIDLGRSRLLHRLRVLDVPWGEPAVDTRRAMGTFRETWRLRWDPMFAVALVTQSRWGNTIDEAADTRLRTEAATLDAVTELAARLEIAINAELPGAVAALVARLAAASAVATDVTALLDALPSLARSLRYGNVRGTDRATLGSVTDGIVVRASVGLSIAVTSLDDDAATEMVGRIESGEAAVSVLERDELRETWYGSLAGVADQRGVNGRIVGRIVRILLDRARLDAEGVATRLAAAISRGATPPEAAAFMEGFLAGPGALLVHDRRLFDIIDDWVAEQSDEAFDAVLPLLRRTFARFTAPERRTLGERARTDRRGRGGAAAPATPTPDAAAPATPAPPPDAATPAATPAPEPVPPALDLLDDLLGLGREKP